MGIIILLFVVLVTGIVWGFVFGFLRAKRKGFDHAKGTAHPIVAWLVTGFASLALLTALAVSIHTWHFVRSAQRTGGTVVDMVQEVDKNSGSISYAPTFQFLDGQGLRHSISSRLYSSPPEFHVDDPVTVLYRTDDPQTALIDSYWQVWGLPNLLAIIGGIGLAFGLSMLCWPRIKIRFGRSAC